MEEKDNLQKVFEKIGINKDPIKKLEKEKEEFIEDLKSLPRKDVHGYIFDFYNNSFREFTVRNILLSEGKNDEVKKIEYNQIIFRFILDNLFPEYIAYDYQYKNETPKGFPDFILIHKVTGEEIFVEMKSKNDSLRFEQLKWFFENNKIKRFVIWINKETGCFGDLIDGLIEKFKKTKEEEFDDELPYKV